MDALSKLVEKWQARMATEDLGGGAYGRVWQTCASELAALRPVIEKLVSTGEAMRDAAAHLDSESPSRNRAAAESFDAWDAALASWRRMNNGE